MAIARYVTMSLFFKRYFVRLLTVCKILFESYMECLKGRLIKILFTSFAIL